MAGPGMREEQISLFALEAQNIFDPIVVFSQTRTWLHSFDPFLIL